MKKPPFAPQERHETIRQQLLRLLDGEILPVSDISKELRQSEKELYYYLDQLIAAGELSIVPPRCAQCGFRFRERKRAKKPSKCPACKSTHIQQPKFTLKR